VPFVRLQGLGKLSKTTAQRICSELRERFEAFKRRDLYEVQLAALFLDAVFLSVRPNGPKEGVLVAWGFTGQGERVLLSVMLGMRESHEDWLELGRDLIARGLGAPLLVVADGAPGADQGRRAVLARLGPPALRRPQGAQPVGQAARAGVGRSVPRSPPTAVRYVSRRRPPSSSLRDVREPTPSPRRRRGYLQRF
jgi:Transposase, Mutator family